MCCWSEHSSKQNNEKKIQPTDKEQTSKTNKKQKNQSDVESWGEKHYTCKEAT